MTQEIGNLIDECMDLESSLGHLALMILTLRFPLSEVESSLGEIPQEMLTKLKNECMDIGGWSVVKERFKTCNEDYRNKLSELAECLENEEFEIEGLRFGLNEKQFSWLKSHVKRIKEQLKGIEI
jgi:hypothetical protein